MEYVVTSLLAGWLTSKLLCRIATHILDLTNRNLLKGEGGDGGGGQVMLQTCAARAR